MNPTFRLNAGLTLRAAAVGLLLFVAGCATPEDAPGPNAKKDAGTAPKAGESSAAMAASGVTPVGALKSARYDPEEFVGYAPDGLLPVLGAPDFVRRDGPAQVWQYRAENCVFDLFLYGDGNSSRVTHVELRERRATDESAEACFSRMRRERASKPAG
jgi:hypothetical protein